MGRIRLLSIVYMEVFKCLQYMVLFFDLNASI